MTLLKRNVQLFVGILFGFALATTFLLGRLSAEAEEPEATGVDAILETLQLTGDGEVTAEEEYLLQMEFAKQQREEEKHNVAPTLLPTRGESAIADRLQYSNQHLTFNRNLPATHDYLVGGDGLDPIVNYVIHKTKDLPHPDGGTMGLDLAYTWSLENSRFSPIAQGKMDERGICQLRYKYHQPFMDSQEFFDVYNQVDYCVDVYLDWYNRKRGKSSIVNVRTARANRQVAAERFTKL